MSAADWITSLDDPALDGLCDRLQEWSPELEPDDAWPGEQLELCASHGVFSWFLSEQWGGQQWPEAEIIRGYLRLSAACLTTTFVITQAMGACRRMAVSDSAAAHALLPELIGGQRFATVGISHLTTSRRHLDRPVLRARETADGYELDGFSPWVTGAPFADTLVMGATLDDGRQLLLAVPGDSPGITVPPSELLVALTASRTGPVRFDGVHVERKWRLAGPVENVMSQGAGARTGGLQTSTLAIGLTAAAIDFLDHEALARSELQAPAAALRAEFDTLRTQLLAAADGTPTCSHETLRTLANSLVLRATQAALGAAKGAGYVRGHPAGRWCREALFFLVWSCPQPVMSANLCELAGIRA